MTSPLVSRSTAEKKRSSHQFIPGIGYLAHSAAPALPAGANGSKNCSPPKGAADRSAHTFQPSHGAPPMDMIWHASEGVWGPFKPGKGNRMGWSPEYLSRAGWEYIGVSGSKASAKRR